jgi:hypothetical protein
MSQDVLNLKFLEIETTINITVKDTDARYLGIASSLSPQKTHICITEDCSTPEDVTAKMLLETDQWCTQMIKNIRDSFKNKSLEFKQKADNFKDASDRISSNIDDTFKDLIMMRHEER